MSAAGSVSLPGATRGRRRRAARAVLAAWALVCLPIAGAQAPAQPAVPIVYVAPIEGIIDLGLAPFVERVLAEATEAKASAVVLEINTFGGRVDAAVLIRDALLRARVRTVAFVNKRAISAGALISLAAETIVMAEGGTIGAATPVQMGAPGDAPKPVDEKTVSYMRKEFRATAESRKRPPLVAEAMVDRRCRHRRGDREGQAPDAHDDRSAEARGRRCPRRQPRGRSQASEAPGRGGAPGRR